MRDKLRQLTSAARHTFTATVGRFGTKTNYKGYDEPTILLKDVQLNSEVMTDHLWFTMGKQFQKLELVPNDIIQFDARVGEYHKGYWRERIMDFRLKFPTNIQKIGHSVDLSTAA